MWMADDVLCTDAEFTAARWVRRRLGEWSHERRVLLIAGALFDLTRRELGLTAADRRLLRLAAVVHDVGRALSEKHHPAEGAEMIARTPALPLTPAERRALAYCTRYHRGAVPMSDDAEYLRPADDRHRLRSILALLRAADALDSRQIESPQLLIRFDKDRLSITCLVCDEIDNARRIYTRRKKFRLLEHMLDRPVHVRVARKESSDMPRKNAVCV